MQGKGGRNREGAILVLRITLQSESTAILVAPGRWWEHAV